MSEEWDISLKRYELESLLKSFLLFFISLGIMLAFLFYQALEKEKSYLDQDLFAQMRLCSFDLKCSNFKIEFRAKAENKPLFLYHDKGGVNAYFKIPHSTSYYMKLSYPKDKYQQNLRKIRTDILVRFLLFLLIVAILALLFSFYALYPMKKALGTVEEFIKDILHDFNTPISSIILNTSLLKKDSQNSEKVSRIEQSSQRILSLQENLKSYLLNIKTQKEYFDLQHLIQARQNVIQKLYPKIRWKIEVPSIQLYTHKRAFERVIDNLLNNAAKYNKTNGMIMIHMDKAKKRLCIEDTGIGIKYPHRVFERFYTEQPRGTGIGLHIVDKLCKELKIGIKVTSSLGKGSKFILSIASLTVR